MTFVKACVLGGLACLAVYLFISAPPPLEAATGRAGMDRALDTRRMFDAVNAVNAATRDLYTRRIVGNGIKAGLKFGEDWAQPGVDKGPLPALFLRLVAARLEAKPPRLGLYLGSDEPINKSNLITGPQAESFARLRAGRAPQYTQVPGVGQVALYPDPASAPACVSCHNAHPDSPKTDWKLDDVMGATTWTYPDDRVGAADYLAATEALYQAVEESYQAYLTKAAGFANPPLVGTVWPEAGLNVLPGADVFMTEVRRLTAEQVLVMLVLRGGVAK